jgi:hypothetical protein
VFLFRWAVDANERGVLVRCVKPVLADQLRGRPQGWLADTKVGQPAYPRYNRGLARGSAPSNPESATEVVAKA